MAIDSKKKRGSVIEIVVPSGSIDEEERPTVAGIYGFKSKSTASQIARISSFRVGNSTEVFGNVESSTNIKFEVCESVHIAAAVI
jgi:hypothetical protein